MKLLGLSFLACTALPLFATPSQCDATPGNLVLNCGFEAGSLPPWVRTESLHDSIGIIVEFANSGDLDVAFNPNGTTSSLSQTIATIPGQTYTFSFFELAEFDRAGTGQFLVDWNGANILTLTGQNVSTYQFHSFTEMATSTTTEIKFTLSSMGSALLDDVVVTSATPEPSSILLAAAGLFGVFLLRKRV